MCTTSWAPSQPGPWAIAPLAIHQGRPWMHKMIPELFAMFDTAKVEIK